MALGPRLIAILIAAAALFAAGAILAVIAVEGYRLSRPEQEAAPAPVASDKPIPALQPIAEAGLTDPTVAATSPFVWIPRATPEAFCKALGQIGLPRPEFQHAQFPAKGWSCVADLLKPVQGDDATVSSLFVSARGLDDERLESFRIKLNLLDPSTAPVTKSLARDLVDRLLGALGYHAPPAVLDALAALKDGVVTDHGVTFDLKKEFAGERYNLVVTFPQRLGTGGADRFLPRPRAGWGAG